MKQYQITIYETEDGKKFNSEEEAKKHESTLASNKALDKFRINKEGPQLIPNDTFTLKSKNYEWFYVKNKEEYYELNKLIYDAYNKRPYQQLARVEEEIKFPTYIYLSHSFNNFGALSLLEDEYNIEKKAWEHFFSFFNNLDEKRIHGVLEEE